MSLVDTSAWVEFLRGTGSHTHLTVRRLLEDNAPVHTTDVVVMEVLAGARDEGHEQQLRRLLARCDYLPVDGLAGYEAAAGLYRVPTSGRDGQSADRLPDRGSGAPGRRFSAAQRSRFRRSRSTRRCPRGTGRTPKARKR